MLVILLSLDSILRRIKPFVQSHCQSFVYSNNLTRPVTTMTLPPHTLLFRMTSQPPEDKLQHLFCLKPEYDAGRGTLISHEKVSQTSLVFVRHYTHRAVCNLDDETWKQAQHRPTNTPLPVCICPSSYVVHPTRTQTIPRPFPIMQIIHTAA